MIENQFVSSEPEKKKEPVGRGLTRQEMIDLGRDPEFITVFVDTISRESKILEALTDAIIHSDYYKEKLNDEIRDIISMEVE